MLTDIFVPLLTYPDAESDDVIESALRFARSFATSVEFCALEVNVPAIGYVFGAEMINVSGLIEEAEKQSRANALRLLKRVASAQSTIPVTTSRVRLREEQVGSSASVMAQLRDLSIVQIRHGDSSQRRLAEDLIFGSGRPLAVLPKAKKHNWSLDHIAIAWDGGRVASQAVHDAMQLLSQTRTVTMLTAFDDKAIGETSTADLRAYLSRHGIAAEHRNLKSAGVAIGEALQDGAIDSGAGLLVMGAFGHSRIREFVMGGATQSTLENVRLPIFFSH